MPVALVTGAGRKRIGHVVALDLAERGFSVGVHYHASSAEAEETVAQLCDRGLDAFAVQADVSQEDDVRRMVDATIERHGRIDALVCAAAIWERKPLADVTAEDVRRHFEVNTLGTFLCCRHVGLQMVRQPEGGAIVTLGDWAVRRPYVDYAAYFPSKGAIPTLTHALAVELAQLNPRVRVNCVEPGPVMLPDDMPEAERHRVVAATLVKRAGRPENVAQAVRMLIENDFITGVCLPVDGGRSVFAGEDDSRPTC